ncbi:N-acetylglucosamine kinase [Consotaella aegiceratis]|uniref:N-acetylglucosamine kinase n=1 Tax=Consotaella aegiceratis TaxID=3097961 RepID=UPI002F414A51
MSDRLILGIDGGGTKVHLALADGSGRLVRQAVGGGVNPIDNPHRWRQTLVAELRAFAGEPRLAAVAAALPAYGEVDEASRQQREAVAEVFDPLPQVVMNDVDAAHVGAFAGEAGILILSGTGSMAWARDDQGRSWRVGGWGDVIGDEGSSHWIGLRVLARVSQSLDGRAGETALVEAVFQHLALDRARPMDALEGWVTRQTNLRAGVASLARIASGLAEAGDAGALGIIDEAADELARHVTAIAAQSGLSPTWSYAGGTFRSQALLRAVADRLGRAPVEPRLPPIGGTLLVAARHLDWPVPPAWIERLAASIAASPAMAEAPQQDN